MLVWLIILSVLDALGIAALLALSSRLDEESVARAEKDAGLDQAIMSHVGAHNRVLRRIRRAEADADPATEDRRFHRYAVVNGKVIDTKAPDAGA